MRVCVRMCVCVCVCVCVPAGGDDKAAGCTQLVTVSLSRHERGLLKMRLMSSQASSSSGRPAAAAASLVIADMYGTGRAISDKLQVCASLI